MAPDKGERLTFLTPVMEDAIYKSDGALKNGCALEGGSLFSLSSLEPILFFLDLQTRREKISTICTVYKPWDRDLILLAGIKQI